MTDQRVDVVVLCGVAGAGKDACAAILQRQIYEAVSARHPADGWGQLGLTEAMAYSHSAPGELVLRWKTLPFSRALKHAAHFMLGIPVDLMFGEAAPDREERRRSWTRYGKNAREWLQWLGTECGRDQIHKSLWIHRFFDQAEIEAEFGAAHTVICAPDGRFANELNQTREIAEQNKQWGCYLIHVKRPGLKPIAGSHSSETETADAPDDMFDLVVMNNGTKEQLAEKLKPALEWLL